MCLLCALSFIVRIKFVVACFWQSATGKMFYSVQIGKSIASNWKTQCEMRRNNGWGCWSKNDGVDWMKARHWAGLAREREEQKWVRVCVKARYTSNLNATNFHFAINVTQCVLLLSFLLLSLSLGLSIPCVSFVFGDNLFSTFVWLPVNTRQMKQITVNTEQQCEAKWRRKCMEQKGVHSNGKGECRHHEKLSPLMHELYEIIVINNKKEENVIRFCHPQK